MTPRYSTVSGKSTLARNDTYQKVDRACQDVVDQRLAVRKVDVLVKHTAADVKNDQDEIMSRRYFTFSLNSEALACSSMHTGRIITEPAPPPLRESCDDRV